MQTGSEYGRRTINYAGRLDGQIASSDPHALVPHPGRAIDESAWQP